MWNYIGSDGLVVFGYHYKAWKETSILTKRIYQEMIAEILRFFRTRGRDDIDTLYLVARTVANTIKDFFFTVGVRKGDTFWKTI